jgi:glutaredoxin
MTHVSVFSADWCGGCKIVKKALVESGIEFEEVDITTKEGGERAKTLGIKSIPVTYVFPFEKPFIGSKPETIKAILEAIID